MKLKALASVIAIAAGSVLAADNAQLNEDDGVTARMVAELIKSRHIAHPEINDELSGQLLDRYLKIWDPQKLYFTKADIDMFQASRKVLDDEIRNGDVAFAGKVYKLFIVRMQDLIGTPDSPGLVPKMIDADHDFEVDEEMLVDADDREWAATPAEVAERWRQRIKFDLLMLKLEDEKLADARKQLHKRYNSNLNLMLQTDANEVLEFYLSSMTRCLDPHSSYMSPKTVDEFDMIMKLRLQGIGARLRYDEGYTVVEEVLKGGPAFADGTLKKGDKIVGVDPDGPAGKEPEIDVVEMKLSRVVDRIRGKADTEVSLKVKHEEGGVETFTLTRGTVKLEDQAVKGDIIEGGEWIDGRKGKIGILNIPSFYRDFQAASQGGAFRSTSKDVKAKLELFRDHDVDALIVDLRWNGGGSLTEAIEVSGLFIPQGPVVQVRAPQNDVTAYKDEDPDMAWRKPMVVVCNRLSASASEIFAGAIQDYRRGIVVGDRTTHGKGTVQNVMNVTSRMALFGKNRGALKLTISKFYRVNGDSTQTKGVPSDIVLPSIWNHRDIGEDALENALAFDRIQRASYIPFTNYRNDGVMQQLAQRSAKRVRNDSEFQKLQDSIDRYIERKDRKTISLKESVLREEEEELKREREEDEEAQKQTTGGGDSEKIFTDTFYNKELLNIALDYNDMLTGKITAGR